MASPFSNNILLVTAVEASKVLYDKNLLDFHRADKRAHAWKEVSKACLFSPGDAEARWGKLRNYYMIYRAKRHNLEMNNDAPSGKTWYLYEHMKFLDAHFPIKKRHSSKRNARAMPSCGGPDGVLGGNPTAPPATHGANSEVPGIGSESAAPTIPRYNTFHEGSLPTMVPPTAAPPVQQFFPGMCGQQACMMSPWDPRTEYHGDMEPRMFQPTAFHPPHPPFHPTPFQPALEYNGDVTGRPLLPPPLPPPEYYGDMFARPVNEGGFPLHFVGGGEASTSSPTPSADDGDLGAAVNAQLAKLGGSARSCFKIDIYKLLQKSQQ